MIVKQPSEHSKDSRWEQGSEFHWMEYIRNEERFKSPWKSDGLLFGSGRDAIKAILLFGMASKGWKRLWIPGYFCQKVAGAILETGINVQCYHSWYPGEKGENNHSSDVIKGDVVLLVNHFGLKSEIKLGFDTRKASAIIEDHTHDPFSSWAFNSKADYCVASLRKTLPVPDGGVLWSPRNKKLPVLPLLTEEHRLAAGNKLEAMQLKDLFLKGEITDKTGYRALFLLGEANLCRPNISAISEWTSQHIGEFPVFEWREARKRNYLVLLEVLSSLLYVQMIRSSKGIDIVPFSAILLFDSAERREFVRGRLIEANIFPAILWTLEKPVIEGIPKEHKDASRRMLSIHCDMRYSASDMTYVAECIKEFGSEFNG